MLIKLIIIFIFILLLLFCVKKMHWSNKNIPLLDLINIRIETNRLSNIDGSSFDKNHRPFNEDIWCRKIYILLDISQPVKLRCLKIDVKRRFLKAVRSCSITKHVLGEKIYRYVLKTHSIYLYTPFATKLT